MKILLLEGIHPAAVSCFEQAEYTVETRPGALSEEELLAYADGLHILGMRSKTRLTARVIERARHLLAAGCFCIGTDQVDTDACTERGIAVFNAPYSNTRSVAELTMANIVMLARKAVQRSMELHAGVWRKSAEGCYEVRNKTLGIVGYGHIGPQIGLLAESFGMRVIFHDIVKKLPLGTAAPVESLETVLKNADFVTLHVPDTERTRNMIDAPQLALMKPGSFLLNLSRGSVVNVAAVRDALDRGHLAGAAMDVYPREPKSGEEPFESELRGAENVILTPHIGGSTEEAQKNIGIEVASALIDFADRGSSAGSVNFPPVDLPMAHDSHRVLHIHRNEPGVLMAVNRIVGELGVNIDAQYLGTRGPLGYLIMDVDKNMSREVKQHMDALPATIRTRLLF